MKVHPLPKKRNNITIQFYDHRGDPLVSSSGGSQHKKLRRLPHIFSRVLELPFRSDADVSVEENPDCFRFVAETDNNIGEVRAHTVEIYPGVTKIVIRPNGYLELSPLDDLELDMWRFRLPETTRPELARAVLADGELIVTVPKGEEVEDEGNGNNNNGEFRGVLVRALVGCSDLVLSIVASVSNVVLDNKRSRHECHECLLASKHKEMEEAVQQQVPDYDLLVASHN
ncbi:hypothetical protein D5086_019681 [Populus alba]|uniref:Uncharacterized protein n=1 Tax=Populus alba TaxID=43335 RepID=A0ACC4BIG7_POPAL